MRISEKFRWQMLFRVFTHWSSFQNGRLQSKHFADSLFYRAMDIHRRWNLLLQREFVLNWAAGIRRKIRLKHCVKRMLSFCEDFSIAHALKVWKMHKQGQMIEDEESANVDANVEEINPPGFTNPPSVSPESWWNNMERNLSLRSFRFAKTPQRTRNSAGSPTRNATPSPPRSGQLRFRDLSGTCLL